MHWNCQSLGSHLHPSGLRPLGWKMTSLWLAISMHPSKWSCNNIVSHWNYTTGYLFVNSHFQIKNYFILNGSKVATKVSGWLGNFSRSSQKTKNASHKIFTTIINALQNKTFLRINASTQILPREKKTVLCCLRKTQIPNNKESTLFKSKSYHQM